jgi:NAD(P)H-hydrate epimerase
MLPLREVAVLDRNAEALGVPVAQLMANAGRAVAEEALRLPGKAVLVLAGPGNNGGDGLVAAKLLARQRKVQVALAVPRAEVRSPPARAALRRLAGSVKVHAAPGEQELGKLLGRSDLVVDALLGAGLHGALREPYRSWVAALNASGTPVLSVDVPTGLGTDLAVRPAVTVTFHDAKEGMTAANSGRIVVADIGIPERAATHTGPGEMLLYPIPRPEQHKGQGGVVLVVGGGPYAGAPALAGMAALRTGADLAIVLAPGACAPLVQAFSPNLIVRPLRGEALDFDAPADRDALEAFLPRATSAVVGNGMGRSDAALRSVPWLLERFARARLPVVVDADALHAVGQLKPELRREVVLTPHAGEFRALTGEELAPEGEARRAQQARAWARQLRCTLVAKGHASVITDGERVKLNSTGNPGMSTGGSGDVLAGATGALLGKRLDPFDAARLAAWMCGRAGDIAFEEKRYGLVATDEVEALPAVLREALKGR